jgi:hypothetical protein
LKRYKLLSITLIFCLVAGLGYLIIDYVIQQYAQKQLLKQINEANQSLQLLPVPDMTVKDKLAAIKLTNQAAKQSLLEGTSNDIDILDSILQLADKCYIRLIPVKTSSWNGKNIGEINYQILPVELHIRGKLSDIILFLGKLEDKESNPGVAVKALSLTINNSVDRSQVHEVSGTLNLNLVSRLVKGN